MSQKTMVRDLTQGNVVRLLLSFAFPFVLSNLLQTLYNMVDLVVVGQFVGKTGLSAVGTGSDVLHLMTFFAIGSSNAGQVMIAQYVGKKDMESVKKTIGCMFTSILALSIVIMFIGVIWDKNILNILNVPAEAYQQAYHYTFVCFLGTFFIYGYNIVSAIMRGMGDSKRPLMFVAIASGINLVLDLLLVAVFKLGTMGAAIATVVGQAFSFIISIVYLYRRKEAFGFDFKPSSFRIQKVVAVPMLKLAGPMILQSCAINFSMLYVTSLINTYGVVASAVTSCGNKLGSIMLIITNSMNLAGASMIGQNIAARNIERVKKIMRTSLLIDCCFAVVLVTIFVLFPEGVFSLFSTDPDVLGMVHTFIPVMVLLFFGYASRAPFFSLINGIGYANLGLIGGLVDGVLARIGLILLFRNVFGMGLMGVWLGNAIAGFAMLFIGGPYYLSGRWKTRKLIIDRD